MSKKDLEYYVRETRTIEGQEKHSMSKNVKKSLYSVSNKIIIIK